MIELVGNLVEASLYGRLLLSKGAFLRPDGDLISIDCVSEVDFWLSRRGSPWSAKLNSIGEKTEPYGTPMLLVRLGDRVLPTLIW